MPASVDTVAADTGPLIALARVDCVRLLPAPFARVLTAPAVLAEVAAGTGCPEGVQIEAAVNAGAIAEKVSALKTEAYFRARRERGDLADFDAWLAASPDQAPEAGDEMPESAMD